ncbi:MAG: asparagine synthase (glutamine-hydrolyzing) [Actinobacteria bacterium]|nr:asparagine synthase (glutamine-hydrolyzing) [Actinomycetota bacterium]
MCGVAAIFDPRGPLSGEAAASICAALRHRGPDGESVANYGPTTLIHTRLAIIDLAGGDQPLHSEDGTCHLVANGEIYNHLELRAELEAAGHTFATHSDCEVIVHAYEEWGPDCVGRLNGIFAFALWDEKRRRLLAARDPFGVKPLYWFERDGKVGVASEVGAFLAADLIEAAVDEVSLEHFLAWCFTPSPRTMFAGVSRLAAASLLLADADGVEVRSYRQAPGDRLTDSADQLAGELASRFQAAVGRQMMSDVPYGAFLSGGVDSAAIAAAMRRQSDEPPLTFTIGFPGADHEVDERIAAAEHAAMIGTHHHSTAMEQGDFTAELDACVRHLEEPTGIPSAPAAFQLSRFAAKSVKVVLSGQGADEPLGGYKRHQGAAMLNLIAAVPSAIARPFTAAIEALPRNERLKRGARLLAPDDHLQRVLQIFEISDAPTRARLTRGPAAAAAAERRELATGVLADLGDDDNPLSQVLYLDTHLFMPDSLLLYGDKTSMANSLEQRVPFLDLELIRFIERIPAGVRVRGLKRKWLYRKALHGIVPEPALRRRKHPFATPYDDWFRSSSLGDQLDRLYAPDSPVAAHIDPDEVHRLTDEHRRGTADHKRVLYCLLEFAYWHRAFIENAQPS